MLNSLPWPLQTYNRTAFEDCSLGKDGQVPANILYRCSFERQRRRGRDSGASIPWQRREQQPQSSASLLTSYHSPSVSSRTRAGYYQSGSGTTGRQTVQQRHRPIGRASRADTIQETQNQQLSGETFKLLVDELAWSSGAPSFKRHRPVFFTGEVVFLLSNGSIRASQNSCPNGNMF